MSENLILRQRTSKKAVDLRALRRIVQTFITQFLQRDLTELGMYVVDPDEMTSLNETFLRHQGATDVITFDYAEHRGAAGPLNGEIFVCLGEARKQARRFGVTWQSEIVRYIVHGVLHLSGYDDKKPAQRARMKREENRLLRALNKRFVFRTLACVKPAKARRNASSLRRTPLPKPRSPKRTRERVT